MILADPAGSVLAEYTRSGHFGTAGSWQVEGIGETSCRQSWISPA
jgi:cystathionine beta-synthase